MIHALEKNIQFSAGWKFSPIISQQGNIIALNVVDVTNNCRSWKN